MIATRLVMMLSTLAVAGCAASPAGSDSGVLARGTWGATNAAVIVTDSVVHVHLGCTFGDLPPDIALDADGRFVRDGSFMLQAYPVQVGPRMPAQFSGQVTGRRLTLVVEVNDTVAKRVVTLGPVTVTLGAEPRMGPCPICSVPKAEGIVIRR